MRLLMTRLLVLLIIICLPGIGSAHVIEGSDLFHSHWSIELFLVLIAIAAAIFALNRK